MVRMQAHAEDEPDASALRTVEIIHIPTGQRKTLRLYDWMCCPFADEEGSLFIAQWNARGNLEIRRYDPSKELKETVAEFDGTRFAATDDSYISSAVCADGNACLQMTVENQESLIVTYDARQGAITAVSTLRAAEGSEYIAELQRAGSVLLAVDGLRWDETIQRRIYRVDMLDANLKRTPLTLAYEDCIDVAADGASGILTAVALADTPASYALCRYALSVP